MREDDPDSRVHHFYEPMPAWHNTGSPCRHCGEPEIWHVEAHYRMWLKLLAEDDP